MFEHCGRRTDGRTTYDGRRLDAYTISSPCEPKGSGELIIMIIIIIIILISIFKEDDVFLPYGPLMNTDNDYS